MNILPNDIVYVSNKSSTAVVLCTYGLDIKSSSPYNKHKKTQADVFSFSCFEDM